MGSHGWPSMNSVIGSGVFGLPAPLAALVGEWSPAAVLLAGACMFVIVLCFAEVGGRFDQAGGPYLYTREAFGARGWISDWVAPHLDATLGRLPQF